MSKLNLATKLAGAASIALMLGGTAFAAPVVQDHDQDNYRTSRISTMGTVTSMIREGNSYRIRLDNGNYDYWVPVSMIGDRDIEPGVSVRLTGFLDNSVVNVDLIGMRGEPYYNSNPEYAEQYSGEPYATVPYGQVGWLNGTVQRTDRHLGYLVIREDTTGRLLKIDVRHMNTHRPVYVWDLRPGDQMSVRGRWENAGLFDAYRIQF